TSATGRASGRGEGRRVWLSTWQATARMASMSNSPEILAPETPPGRKTPAVWLATGAGLGFVPFAPGTLAAVWGIPLAWGLGDLSFAWQAAAVALLVLAGVPLCAAAARDLGRKDPGSVIWDEIVTMPIVFFLVPSREPVVLLAGFLLHR